MNFTDKFVHAAFSREKVESVLVYFKGNHHSGLFPKKLAFTEMIYDPTVQFIADAETGEIIWPEI
ncbi:MAG: hypothetical protein LUD47_03055 [Clostridia bacterium]|nr:hypothetical protein [Clostridia bacterium]